MRISDWSSDVCSSDLSGGHQIQIADRLGDPRIGLALGCGEQLPIFRIGDILEQVDGRIFAFDQADGRRPVDRKQGGDDHPRITTRRGSCRASGARASRSVERRVGKECVTTCRSRWSTEPEKIDEPTLISNASNTTPTVTTK